VRPVVKRAELVEGEEGHERGALGVVGDADIAGDFVIERGGALGLLPGVSAILRVSDAGRDLICRDQLLRVVGVHRDGRLIEIARLGDINDLRAGNRGKSRGRRS
jgi:hypothetical protein